VGGCFNANELMWRRYCSRREAMKAAVSTWNSSWRRRTTAKRGKVVLATVKGDVHDIGKNLVEIILKNNGLTS